MTHTKKLAWVRDWLASTQIPDDLVLRISFDRVDELPTIQLDGKEFLLRYRGKDGKITKRGGYVHYHVVDNGVNVVAAVKAEEPELYAVI